MERETAEVGALVAPPPLLREEKSNQCSNHAPKGGEMFYCQFHLYTHMDPKHKGGPHREGP